MSSYLNHKELLQEALFEEFSNYSEEEQEAIKKWILLLLQNKLYMFYTPGMIKKISLDVANDLTIRSFIMSFYYRVNAVFAFDKGSPSHFEIYESVRKFHKGLAGSHSLVAEDVATSLMLSEKELQSLEEENVWYHTLYLLISSNTIRAVLHERAY